jgi:hypothetical protein
MRIASLSSQSFERNRLPNAAARAGTGNFFEYQPVAGVFVGFAGPRILSDTTKIILERRIGELRIDIAAALKRGNHLKADQLHNELTAHQAALGFTLDEPPPKPKTPRKEECHDLTAFPNGLHLRKSEEPSSSFAAPWDGQSKDENL